jgi:hypothetical protein
MFIRILVLLSGDRRLTVLFNMFMPSLFAPTAQGPRHHKPREKQVAMIAQKVVDANQTHEQRRPFIASSNA